MAIKYKAISDKIKKSPFSEAELSVIEYVEKYIDKKIETDFNGHDVSIELGIANFNYNSGNRASYVIPDFRKQLMFKELERRYRNAGWKAVVIYGEDDGPNRPGFDYWVLSGKAR